jgi:tripartite-type tricarboxylate transporter receptor subunit TctC
MHRRQLIRAIGASPLLATPLLAQAQDKYPSRAIQVVVGFPGGGAMDVATRVVTHALADEGLAPLAIINKPGASATIATGQVARAPADGYTVLLSTSANLGIAPYLYARLPYNHETALVPVAQFGVAQSVIYCSPSLGVRDVNALLRRIAAAPGKLNYASPGSGTTAHLAFETVKANRKLFIVHVPFRGSPAAITSVLSGELDIGIDAIGPTLAHIKAGKLVPLAQTGPKRSASLPDVPTLDEMGVRGIPSGTNLGFMMPSGTPAAVLAQWSDAMKRVLATPAVAEQLSAVGVDVAYQGARDYAATMASEQKLWQAAVKYSGAAAS